MSGAALTYLALPGSETDLMRIALATIAVLFTTSLPASAQSWQNVTCAELWRERNLIYKDAGYCFKTARAIRTFGNAGCRHDAVEDVPLSANQRMEVTEMVRAERLKSCPR
jgi:hypothetical protein